MSRKNVINKIRKEKIAANVFRDENERLIRLRKGSLFSKGESEVAKVLTQNRVFFYTEFYFTNLKVGGKTKALFFDFYCPDVNLCIEFDGQQHYTEMFNGKKLENIRRNDFLKSAFCLKKKIALLRIKFSEIENIEDIICRAFDKVSPI